MTAFIHLRVHTEFSLVDGLCRVKKLVAQSKKLGMPAVAVTDIMNLFGLVKLQKAASAEGIKPIFGADLWVHGEDPTEAPSLITVLVKDKQGYLNLTELISEGYVKGQQRGIAVLRRDWLVGKTEGLIALSGGRTGDIGQALLNNRHDLAEKRVAFWASLFPNRFYLELQRTGRPHEEDYIHFAVELAAKCDIPVVATNDVRFLNPDDYEAHEVRVCIHEGRVLDDPRRPRPYSDQQYLRSPEEMQELFSDIPEALENTVEIAKRCSLKVRLGEYFLPNYPIPEGMTMDEYFRLEARTGLDARLDFLFGANPEIRAAKAIEYRERLELELDCIINMGFPGYFLIVADFIQWAKDNGIPVGPGRGSGAGSLVAYSIRITDLDPIAYDLLFERFLNPERVSMPDFDVDFCMDGRDAVIDYVARKYGREAVSQIITFGTMAAKAVVRDVGRVFGKPYGFVDRIAKLVPFEVGITLEKAMQDEPQLKELFEKDEEVREMLSMALKLEGLTRNVGKHAGGVVIAPSKLTDFSPLFCDETGSNLVTQFDKDDVEQAGLVKFDFLGLRTLTIIDWALKTINAKRALKGEDALEIMRVPLEDAPSFKMLQAAETTAVFQLESRGMKDLIKRLQPSTFEDIIALVALFRPGPLQSGMVDDFINRKHGRAKVEFPHPSLEPVLRNTYGVIVYQEQVMQIAQVLSGYTLGGADMLRRAMGKKKPEEMAKQRSIFVEGAQNNNVPDEQSGGIFDLMEKFAAYGFNKSHSAAYALVSFHTLWLKCHYPAEFMAAVLSADMHNTDKVVTLVEECRNMKLKIMPPDVNYSEFKFTVDDNGCIIYGLGAIKGLGEGPIETIVDARQKGGAFKDLFEFCRRIDMSKINRRSMEALIRSGALDKFGRRAVLMANLEEAIKAADQHNKNQNAGMLDLFGDVMESPSETPSLVQVPDWTDDERLNGERDTLGLYLTGHPIDQFEQELSHFTSSKIVDLKPTDRGNKTVIAGLVVAMRTMNSKRGGKMAFMTLDDRSGRVEVSVFGEVYEQNRAALEKDGVVVVEGECAIDDYSGNMKMVAKRLLSINEARAQYAKTLTLTFAGDPLSTDWVLKLQHILTPHINGPCKVKIEYNRGDVAGTLQLGENWRVVAKPELLLQLQTICGAKNVNILYR